MTGNDNMNNTGYPRCFQVFNALIVYGDHAIESSDLFFREGFRQGKPSLAHLYGRYLELNKIYSENSYFEVNYRFKIVLLTSIMAV